MLARPLTAQERGAAALGELIDGLGVNTRVLMIGAHPDDEDTFLITWLQRGRHVETAYLSLTRGDGGQNLIGNELGEALGVIRTEELLAARRIDGARQYFTRAFDFGFSKDTIDTYKHWQRDSILNDIVRVVRMFRPHVIVAVFSGTPRDGHGHHQVSGLLARAAYDIAGDTVRFPSKEYGAAWTPLKFYRVARPPSQATLSIDVGEYSPLLGRSFGEIAGESRSQHKSQGFGVLQRKGPIIDNLMREASRVNAGSTANAESGLFDGIDTTWGRFRAGSATSTRLAFVDSIPAAVAAARAAYDPFAPWKTIAPIARLRMLSVMTDTSDADLAASVRQLVMRATLALRAASGVTVEVSAPREVYAAGDSARFAVTVFNRGHDTVGVIPLARMASPPTAHVIPPGGVFRDTMLTRMSDSLSQPWWLTSGRAEGMFRTRPREEGDFERVVGRPMSASSAVHVVTLRGPIALTSIEPAMYTFADQVKGAMERSVDVVPAISVSLNQQSQFAPAGVPIERDLEVRLRSASTRAREVRVTLALPKGLQADSVSRAVRLPGYDATATVTFRIRGQLAAGSHRVDALAESEGQTFASGYDLVDYDHIRRQRIYRPASIKLSAVAVSVPAALRVAYIAGVGDNIAPALNQLGIPTTVIQAGDVGRADLNQYSTVVVGPRAYEAHPELLAANPKLFDFAKKGGVLLVQYGQYEMTQPGAMPFPITLGRPAVRVTEEDAVVTIDAPNARELNYPNKIGASDFDGWVQERSLYMPSTFDPNYRTMFSMHDTNEPPNKGAVLIAPLGDGLYVYSTLSFFRQLPAGVPGGARLFVNLLSAKLAPTVTP